MKVMIYEVRFTSLTRTRTLNNQLKFFNILQTTQSLHSNILHLKSIK